MSATGYKNIVVLGATGLVGKPITAELVAEGFNVTIFSRNADASVPGAKTVVVSDPTNVDDLTSKLKGIDAVVSTVAFPAGLEAQNAAIQAAAKAGVKRFIPSEYGMNHYVIDNPAFKPKKDAVDLIKSSGMEYTVIAVGLFADTSFGPFISFDPAAGTARVVEKLDSPVAYTSLKDIGRVVAGVLRSKNAANSIVSVASEIMSDRQAIKVLESTTGKKFHVTVQKPEDVQAEIAQKFDFGRMLTIFKGSGLISHQNQFSDFVKGKPYTATEFLTVTKGGLEDTANWYNSVKH